MIGQLNELDYSVVLNEEANPVNQDSLVVKVTHEGIILDAYTGTENVGSKAQEFHEWFYDLTVGGKNDPDYREMLGQLEDILGAVEQAYLIAGYKRDNFDPAVERALLAILEKHHGQYEPAK